MEVRSFTVHFRIPGAIEPDAYAVRAYESDRLDDIALGGPDDQSVFEAEFDRESDSTSEVLEPIRLRPLVRAPGRACGRAYGLPIRTRLAPQQALAALTAADPALSPIENRVTDRDRRR